MNDRQTALSKLHFSRLVQLRAAFQAFKRMSCFLFMSYAKRGDYLAIFAYILL